MGDHREYIREEITCGLNGLQEEIMEKEWCRITEPHRPLIELIAKGK